MEKFGYMLLALCMLTGMIAGCGATDSDETILIVGKNGKVQSIDVEAFDKSYYTEEDFKSFAEDAITTYNKTHEVDAVTLTSFTVEEDTAKLKMEFKSVEDYSSFTDIPLYQGTVAQAYAAGYKFDTSFSRVEKGEIVGTAAKSEILESEKLHVVIIAANTDVQVAGKIIYVSTDNVTVTAKDTISIRDEENPSLESDKYTYIIYK